MNNQNQEKEKDKTIQIKEYLTSLKEIEKNAYSIAQQHLGTSFDIERSNGYKEWLKKNTH